MRRKAMTTTQGSLFELPPVQGQTPPPALAAEAAAPPPAHLGPTFTQYLAFEKREDAARRYGPLRVLYVLFRRHMGSCSAHVPTLQVELRAETQGQLLRGVMVACLPLVRRHLGLELEECYTRILNTSEDAQPLRITGE